MRYVSKLMLNGQEYQFKKYTVTTPGIYYNSTLGLISISRDGQNWITISDKNAGATTVWNQGDAKTETNCGYHYQRGNCNGFPFTQSITTDSNQVDASSYGPSNYYYGSNFINIPYGNWDSSDNTDLWGNDTDTVEARRGMCDEGFHIPSYDERYLVEGILNSDFGIGTTETYQNLLKMPLAGCRDYDGNVFGNTGYYYFSSKGYFDFGSGRVNGSYNYLSRGTCNAYSIRPFKNESVQPDGDWDILYQPN